MSKQNSFTLLTFTTLSLGVLNCSKPSASTTEAPQAVTSSSEANGFKLSPAAEKMIEVSRQTVSKAEVHTFPTSAVVEELDKVGIYRFRDSWYKWVPITVISRSDKLITFKSHDLELGDSVAVGGAALLQVTNMFLLEGEE